MHAPLSKPEGRPGHNLKAKGVMFSRRNFLRAASLAAPFAAVTHSLCIEPSWVRTRTIRLGSGTPTHRFVQISDLHHKGDRAFLERIVGMINALTPDFVCFTGDLVEESEHAAEAAELLSRIRAPLYGIPGNHDYWADADFELIGEHFAATGGKWLMDQTVITADGQWAIHGATCTETPSFELRKDRRNLLLIHYPYWIERFSEQKFDLALAGHSHGGQIRLPFIGPILIPSGVGEYDWGLFQTSTGPLYVNAGLGYFYANVRFCCRPEITLFEV